MFSIKKNFTFVYNLTGLYRRRACRVPHTLGARTHIPKHTSSVAMSRTRTRAIIYPLCYNKPDNKNVGLVAKNGKYKMKNTYTWHVVANKLLINLFPLKPQMGLVFRGDESQYRAMAARIRDTFASLAL